MPSDAMFSPFSMWTNILEKKPENTMVAPQTKTKKKGRKIMS